MEDRDDELLRVGDIVLTLTLDGGVSVTVTVPTYVKESDVDAGVMEGSDGSVVAYDRRVNAKGDDE